MSRHVLIVHSVWPVEKTDKKTFIRGRNAILCGFLQERRPSFFYNTHLHFHVSCPIYFIYLSITGIRIFTTFLIKGIRFCICSVLTFDRLCTLADQSIISILHEPIKYECIVFSERRAWSQFRQVARSVPPEHGNSYLPGCCLVVIVCLRGFSAQPFCMAYHYQF